MALSYNNDFYTHTFTPREYQVELLEKIKHSNTVICSNTSGAKAFIAVKLLQELAWQLREPHQKRAFYVLEPQNTKVLASHLSLLTDVPVITITNKVSISKWAEIRRDNAVFIMTLEICLDILSICVDLSFISFVIIDDGMYGETQTLLRQLMDQLIVTKPRIVGLVSGLLGENLRPALLEAEMLRLEDLLDSSVDTSSEITTLIRLSSKPRELIISCTTLECNEVHDTIKNLVLNAREFILEHRFDPSEIYSDEFLEDFRNIPDPKIAPLQFIDDFLFILEEYGLWCADVAALRILAYIEKLKVKVAYERHYLLLCVVTTVMVSVRAHCENLVEAKDILGNSTNKIHRLLEVLRELGPNESEKPNQEDHVVPVVEPIVHKSGKKSYKGQRRPYQQRPQPDDTICALIFVENSLIAQVLHSVLSNYAQTDSSLWWMGVLYTADKTADPLTESHEAEIEHRRQEEVLRKFRAHDCNIMVATSILEQGYDLPKCNLVIKLDVPKTFHSYIYTKARARTPTSYYICLVFESNLSSVVQQYSEYMEVENVLLRRCGNINPSPSELKECDQYCENYAPYVTAQKETVSLNTAIQLINRYCAKLPSDTFTKLVPNYDFIRKEDLVACKLRLPINSPVKLAVQSPYLKNEVLAKRFAAFYMCQLLHKSNELDDFLNPITKENFRAIEDDWNDFSLEREDEELSNENVEQRPGTTKRRQYYYKRVAAALKDCLPQIKNTYFYKIVMTLTCPIPEEQNTRGRKIYPPEESKQGFGILTSQEIPQICPFPIFTRSGEVNVSLELCNENISLTDAQIHKISEFLNYTFTSVLRLQKYQMDFKPEDAESSYFIVPTITEENTEIDWDFLDVIYKHRDILPKSIPDEDRLNYVFEGTQYKDAVVMPWYRNQDQPQYFYVAEICTTLNPASAFPGSEYATFHEYYERKYGIQIQNKEQHLLDVDHTSARLNFLTPRYVNRKGVALPTSSEETKRAKRENLEQKQILVPELCAIHPFPASLWRKAVCLPCILYRVNALLLADQIRRTVAEEIKLGKTHLPRTFKWEPLNFGWSLSDVLKKTKPPEKLIYPSIEEGRDIVSFILKELISESVDKSEEQKLLRIEEDENSSDSSEKPWMEIGTWSNDMVENTEDTTIKTSIRYGSPTSWMHSTYGYNEYDDFSDTESDYSDYEPTNDSECGGLHIEFQGDFLAEAVDQAKEEIIEHKLHMTTAWDNSPEMPQQLQDNFETACNIHKEYILKNMVIKSEFVRERTNNNNMAEFKTETTNLKIANYDCPKLNYRRSGPKDENISDYIEGFSFDKQPDLVTNPGPSPSVILQALTMSNANDGINLERLETIGDSFLKYAITDYLYSKYENTHEGKLSHLRSKQVSNLNLYRLGKRKRLGELMIATKFDPHDNWLPPCYCVSKELEEALSKARIPFNYLTLADYVATRNMSLEERCLKIREQGEINEDLESDIIPYNLVTQHSIPDKSIADCVEALIGAYLIECGPRGALLFMAWLGIRVLPKLSYNTYGELQIPYSPLLQHVPEPENKLLLLLNGYDAFEDILGYKFRDRAYLLQALTDASYSPNEITDCYQRLEFLGDAVLDYLITRHLYEDQRMHSPGALTDLRSALVNNTIFASLAVKYNYHKYFRYLSPGLHQVIEKFIRMQEEAGHKVSEELYLLDVEDTEEVEDVEVPKVLGDVFESVAGAIFLDSGRSLDAVWRVYYKMMKNEIEQFSDKVPKSPIRELLELEPETAKFGPAEKLADGRRVRVTVEVFGKGVFKGIGRNYRIAKCTAAKCALKQLKKQSARLI